MVVLCPKCKTRLKVDEERIAPEGSRFKCPKCSSVLVAKRPVPPPKKVLDSSLILVAHANPAVRESVTAIGAKHGYRVISAADGIEAMVKALKDLPFLVLVEAALPKIYGFEVCKRLKSRPESKDMKLMLVPAIHDKAKYRREPVSLYGADDYVEEHEIESSLIDKIRGLSLPKEGRQEQAAPMPEKAPGKSREQQPAGRLEPAASPSAPQVPPVMASPEAGRGDEQTERARRLARTIVNDIYLYNSAKVDEAIRTDTFFTAFAPEVKEGRKLYDSRIAKEVREKGDFFKEAIEGFIEVKKGKKS